MNEAAQCAERGYAELVAGRPDSALKLFQRAVALGADDARLHTLLGVAYSQTGRLGEAAECYRRAIRVDPAFIEAHANLGSALQRQRDLDGALRSYAAAYALKPALLRQIALNVAGSGRGALWLDPADLAAHLRSLTGDRGGRER